MKIIISRIEVLSVPYGGFICAFQWRFLRWSTRQSIAFTLRLNPIPTDDTVISILSSVYECHFIFVIVVIFKLRKTAKQAIKRAAEIAADCGCGRRL